MKKKFDSLLIQISESLRYAGVLVPAQIAKEFVEGDNSRVLCAINGNEAFQGALMPKGDSSYFINVNKSRRKQYKIALGDTVSVELQKDNSKYGLPLPDEFQELLYQDPEGSRIFHSLTMGKQRSLIYIIGKPKSSTLKIEKGITVLDYLKKANGKLDFKELNQAFKEANMKR